MSTEITEPTEAKFLHVLRHGWGEVWVPPEPVDLDHVWADIRRETRLPAVGKPVVGRSVPGARYRYVGVPLAIAAALTIGFFAIKQIPDTPKPAPPTKTYSTSNGQRANITLADGSQVILAPATTMRVSGRNVELNGEAVFTVTQHTSTPFTVQAGNTITRVLGTTFGVKAYGDQIRVAVKDGRVSVGGRESGFLQRASAANAERSSAVVPLQQQGQARTSSLKESQTATVLGAGDYATIQNDQIQIHKNANVAAMLAWTTGQLSFQGVPFADAVPELERAFDIDIQIDDPHLSQVRMSVMLDGLSVTDMLNTIAPVLDATYKRDGRVVVFRRK